MGRVGQRLVPGPDPLVVGDQLPVADHRTRLRSARTSTRRPTTCGRPVTLTEWEARFESGDAVQHEAAEPVGSTAVSD